jgi:hypothetical protein
LSIVFAMLSMPLVASAQASSDPALTPAEREAQQMGLEMAFVCNPRRQRQAGGSVSTIQRDGGPLAGTAVFVSGVEGTFVALEQYDEALEGHCLVFGWWGGDLAPGTYPVSRLAMSTMEAEEMSDSHSFFSWGAVRTAAGNEMLVVEGGSIELTAVEPNRLTGVFELHGFTVEGSARSDGVVWAGTFSGMSGDGL